MTGARPESQADDTLDQLTKRNVKLSIGASVHDLTDAVWRLLFKCLQWSPN